jgi:predicted N-formylglutamate amidohydrolase
MKEPARHLLAAGEPSPVTVYNPNGGSPFLLVADHAGNVIPRALGRLGVAPHELRRHIAWDIGIAGVGRILADTLGAVLIQQNYSRLVIDCNRPPGMPSSTPEVSELTRIPGNSALSDEDKALRVKEIFSPYHERIDTEIKRRWRVRMPAVLISLHSFTPIFKGVPRPWHVSVLYNRDPRLPRHLLAILKAETGLAVGNNEPYVVSDSTDYTIPVHGERMGLPHALIEIRQDLIAEERGQHTWALRLARLLPKAYAGMAAT